MPYGYALIWSDRRRNRLLRWTPDSGALSVISEANHLRDPYGVAADGACALRRNERRADR
jgi:sugar lactone lactonase YvrE